MIFPVAYEKLSQAIDAATLATSYGLPHLFFEDSLIAFFSSSTSIDLQVDSVLISPKVEQYALMSSLEYSLAIHFVSGIFASLAIVCGNPFVYPVILGVNEIFIITLSLTFFLFLIYLLCYM